jgi:hypothetical protein
MNCLQSSLFGNWGQISNEKRASRLLEGASNSTSAKIVSFPTVIDETGGLEAEPM